MRSMTSYWIGALMGLACVVAFASALLAANERAALPVFSQITEEGHHDG